MTVQGNYQVQGMIEQSPKGFNWAMFPPLKGASQDQAANPQTLSISQQSSHKEEAMKFIAYVAEHAEHGQARPGRLADPGRRRPPRPSSSSRRSTTARWRNAISAVPSFKKANWVSLTNYPRWKAEVATPAFRLYLGNQIDLRHADQAADRRMEQHSRRRELATEEATCARPARSDRPAGRKPRPRTEGAGRR